MTRNLVRPVLEELGRKVRTLFACECLPQPELQREVHARLQVVETWNSDNGVVVAV